jgi:guanine deaminase
MTGLEILRASLYHTPAHASSSTGSPSARLVAHEDGALAVQHGRIVASGEYHTIRDRFPEARTTDWRGGFLLPGFVDTHTHFPQARIVGRLGRTLEEWLDEIALPEEARQQDVDYAHETARRFVSALVAHGTTTALVFGAHFAPATAALFQAAADSGLRMASGLVMSDRLLRPELHQSTTDAYKDSNELIRCFHKHGRLLYAVTPRFALSTSEAMLEVCQTLLREHTELRFQTHINESQAEVAECARRFPWARDYLAVYERYHLEGPMSVMAHNVHAKRSELERLAASRTSVAHCPASNLALGSGIFPMQRHADAGVRYALGTDVGAGTGFGILKEALQAHLVQRIAPEPMVLDAARLLYLSTLAGAEALGLAREIGDFSDGKAADFVYLRARNGSPLDTVLERAETPVARLTALFVHAGSEAVRHVRVEGTVVYSSGDAVGGES